MTVRSTELHSVLGNPLYDLWMKLTNTQGGTSDHSTDHAHAAAVLVTGFD
jgi:hypothetical protein